VAQSVAQGGGGKRFGVPCVQQLGESAARRRRLQSVSYTQQRARVAGWLRARHRGA